MKSRIDRHSPDSLTSHVSPAPVSASLLLSLAALAVGVFSPPAALAGADDKATPGGESNAASDTGPKYSMRYQFEAGQTLRWEVTHTASVRTTIKGTTQTAKTWSESVKAWKITDVAEDGEATIINSVESVKMSNELPNRPKVEYDSQKDVHPPRGFERTAEAIGRPLTMLRIDRQGKLLKHEARQEQAERGAGDGPITLPLPTEPVPVGHVWTCGLTQDVALQDGAKRRINARMRYELQSVDDRVASINVEYQVLDPKILRDPTIMAQLAQRQIKGVIRFDLDAGRVVGQERKVDSHVVGFSGPASSMHYVMEFTERSLKPDEKVAKRPPRPAGPERPR